MPDKSVGNDRSTEEKIKDAARTVFHNKGFAATRTRDISDEAGINLSLLNYYFRSKSKLFEIVMLETLSGFLRNLMVVVNNPDTTLEEKLGEITSRYIDLIIKEPEIPTFIITEVRNNPGIVLKKLPVKDILSQSVLFKQFNEAVSHGLIKEKKPLHFVFNFIGLIIFPFIAKPMIMGVSGIKNEKFNEMMEERKKLIPVWLKAMMSS